MNAQSKYSPQIHHRRSIRLKGYDYSQSGLYFITICCQDRICRFGEIKNGEMQLNEYGQIAYDEWICLQQRYPSVELDVFQIMPNHLHGIIILNDTPVGAGFTPAQNTEANTRATARVAPTQPPTQSPTQPPIVPNSPTIIQPPTLSDIVGAYKSLVTNGCLKIYKSKNETMGKLLQRNYYEHIIRNRQAYQKIAEYIINNPAQWADDKFYIQ